MKTRIHPIRDDKDHASALAEIERLWNAEPGTAEADFLEVLSTLVDAYEQAHHAIGPPDPIEAIKFRMEQIGIERAGLAEIVGGKSRASEILSRKRRLSLPMIRSLNKALGIPAEVLIREVSLASKKSASGAKPMASTKRSKPKRAAAKAARPARRHAKA